MCSNTCCNRSGFTRILYTKALYTEPFVSSCSDISLPILNAFVSLDLFLDIKVVITARGACSPSNPIRVKCVPMSISIVLPYSGSFSELNYSRKGPAYTNSCF